LIAPKKRIQSNTSMTNEAGIDLQGGTVRLELGVALER
jgi:hypothetical protein